MSTPSETTVASPRPPTDPLARQLKLFKALALILLLVVAAGAGYFFYQRHVGQPVAILVDGKQIAIVRNMSAANKILKAAQEAKIGQAYANEDPVRLQKIQMVRVSTGAPIDADATVQDKLRTMLKLHIHAYVIMLDGNPTFGLPTSDEAAEVLHLVKEHFAALPPQADIVGEPEFVNRVSVKRMAIDTSRARTDPAEVAPYYWTPPPSKTVVVKNHDTGYAIAKRNHIAFSDFLAVNAGHDLNHLKPGDTVIIQKSALQIQVRVKKKFASNEQILANAPASQAGKRHVTYLVTYTNGTETSRDVLDMHTLEKPRTRDEL